jgi:hypothetical protein
MSDPHSQTNRNAESRRSNAMPTDVSLKALREANPLHQPGFAESIEGYDALRTQIVSTPVAAPSRPPQLTARRRLIGLSAAAAVSLAGVLVALTLSAASPRSAYAAARKAVAATSAGAVDSGTMTLAVALGGTTRSDLTARWNGNDISMSGLLLDGDQQVELIGGEVYVQGPHGTWLHYASESDSGFPAGQMLQLARDYVSGSRPDQIVALVPGLQEIVQPNGSTIFTGTIPAGEPAEVAPTNEPGVSLGPTLPHFRTDAQFQMVVGSDGLVRQISESADDGTWTWTMQYSQLGSTPPISAPATSTKATPGTPPTTPPHETVPETVPYPTDTTAP